MPAELKDGVKAEEILSLHPFMYPIIGFFIGYCDAHKLPCVFTSITGHALGRISKTHSEGRGVDARSRGWSDFHKQRIVHLINKKFKGTAARSKSDGKARAIILHSVKGGAEHFHMQCRPGKLQNI